MAANIPIDELKKMIENNIKTSDKKSLMRNLQIFTELYKENIAKDELDNLQILLTDLRRSNEHAATSYEYILFFVVLFILLSIFGEANANFNICFFVSLII